MTRDANVYLLQIQEAVNRIRRYTEGGREGFLADSMVQDAVLRNLQVIGEATKRIPDDFRKAHPGVRWRGMAGLRDVLIHQYDTIDLDRVWAVIEKDLREVSDQLLALTGPHTSPADE